MFRLLARCCTLLLPLGLWAQDGSLDPAFGAGGKAYITPPGLNQSLSKTVVQPDGKVVIAGRATDCCGYDFSVARFKTDGTPDETFDGDGFVVTEVVAGAWDIITTVAVQPDGKILAGGYSNNDFALVRYNPDGTLDAGFNGTGKVVTDLSGTSEIYALALLINGKILAAGSSQPGAGPSHFTLVRYNADGSLDPSFDGDGIVTTPVGSLPDIAYALLVQPDGKILAAGVGNNGGGDDFALLRYNSDGTPDVTFNGTGRATVDFGANDRAYSVALQPDGRILLAGVSNTDQTFHAALARLLPNGLPDPAFDGDGKWVSGAGMSDQFYSVLVQQDGKIVAGGTLYTANSSDYLLDRFTADGSPDPGFDGDGSLSLDMGADEAYATLAGWNNFLVIGGYSNNRLAAARLNNSSGISVLPLKLLSFTAVQQDGSVSLRWSVASNDPVTGFFIEESADGRSFTQVAVVPARQGSGSMAYRYNLPAATGGLRYYRIRLDEPGRQYRYSDQVAVLLKKREEALTLLRNPVGDILFLQVDAGRGAKLFLFDAAGRLVQQWQLEQGLISMSVPLRGKAGLYHLRLESQQGSRTRSFLKQ